MKNTIAVVKLAAIAAFLVTLGATYTPCSTTATNGRSIWPRWC